MIAGHYIVEVLREGVLFRTPVGVFEKRVFWDNRIVSDSLPGLSGLGGQGEREGNAAGEGEGEMEGGSALARG